MELISAKEAAAMLGVSDKTIIRYVQNGILEGHKLEKLYKINKESVLAYKERTKL